MLRSATVRAHRDPVGPHSPAHEVEGHIRVGEVPDGFQKGRRVLGLGLVLRLGLLCASCLLCLKSTPGVYQPYECRVKPREPVLNRGQLGNPQNRLRTGSLVHPDLYPGRLRLSISLRCRGSFGQRHQPPSSFFCEIKTFSESLLNIACRDPVLCRGPCRALWLRLVRRSAAPAVQERRP